MFPIGDSPNPRGIAWVTYALIAVNVIVFVAYVPAMGQAADPNDPRVGEYVETIGKETGASPRDIETARKQLTAYDLVVYEHGSRPAHPSWLGPPSSNLYGTSSFEMKKWFGPASSAMASCFPYSAAMCGPYTLYAE